MKISLICPAHNEENNLGQLFESILRQTKKVNEIIFVEDSSLDDTFNVLKKFQKKNKNVKIFRVNNRNISKNRNLAINKSKGDIIVCIDAGCVFDKNYIKKITSPFKNKKIKFAGGISKILTKNLFDGCFSHFIVREKVPSDYLPKGHAMAFRKSLWRKAGGFPEHLALGAEDTYFGKEIVKMGVDPFIVKDAIVYWETRGDLKTIYRQFRSYGYWDGRAFVFRELPKKSKLATFIAIVFPLALIHSIFKGLYLSLKFKKIMAFFYGVGIDLAKIYGYIFGLIQGRFS